MVAAIIMEPVKMSGNQLRLVFLPEAALAFFSMERREDAGSVCVVVLKLIL